MNTSFIICGPILLAASSCQQPYNNWASEDWRWRAGNLPAVPSAFLPYPSQTSASSTQPCQTLPFSDSLSHNGLRTLGGIPSNWDCTEPSEYRVTSELKTRLQVWQGNKDLKFRLKFEFCTNGSDQGLEAFDEYTGQIDGSNRIQSPGSLVSPNWTLCSQSEHSKAARVQMFNQIAQPNYLLAS